MIITILTTMTLGQTLFTAHLLILRVKHSNVYLPLAGFFLVLATFHAYHLLRDEALVSLIAPFSDELMLIKQLVELNLIPLFWLYIRELTSKQSGGYRFRDTLHVLVPLIFSIFSAICLLFIAPNIDVNGVSRTFVSNLNEALNIAILAQFFIYAWLVMKRLFDYQKKLKGLFANASNLVEMKWFRWVVFLIVITLVIEVAAQFFYHTQEAPYTFHIVNAFVRFTLVWFFATWGLRQRPDLMIEVAKTEKSIAKTRKYQRSAMTDLKLTQVSDKIRAALENENLYRDPNLSLRSLSEHIDVLPNYVTQALNVEMNESFFDYVNGLRIREAINMLEKSDDTVLNICSEVGFNSRSSFYTAFKKVTGKTPAAYRNPS